MKWRAQLGSGSAPSFKPPPLVGYQDESGNPVGRCPGCYTNKYQAERKVLQVCRNGSPIYHVGTAIGDVWGGDVWAGGCYIPPYGPQPGAGRDVYSMEPVATSPAEQCGGFLCIVCGTNRTGIGDAPTNFFKLSNKAVKLVIGAVTTDNGLVIKTGFGSMGEDGVDVPPGTPGTGHRQYRTPGWASFGTGGDAPAPDPGKDTYDPSSTADFVKSRYYYCYDKNVETNTAPRANLNQYVTLDTTYDIGSPGGVGYNFTGLIKYEGQDYSHGRNLNVDFLPRYGAYVNEVCGSNRAFDNDWGWYEPFSYHGTYRSGDMMYVPFYVSGDNSELGNHPILQCMNRSWSPIDRPITGWNAWMLMAVCPPELVPYLGLEEVEY